MRRTGVFLAALAVTLLVATAGTAAPPSVTISLSRPSVVYGGSVALSGKVSNNKTGETVVARSRYRSSLDVVRRRSFCFARPGQRNG